MGTAGTRTQALVDEVEALGTPDVENGEEVRTALTGAFEQVVAAVRRGRRPTSKGSSTDDPAALAEGFTEVASEAAGSGTEI